MFNTKILELLVCPVSRLPLKYDATRHILLSVDGKHEYKIINNMPILMAETSVRDSE